MNATDKAHVRAVITEKIAELRLVVESDAKAQDQIELDQTRVGRLARMDAVQHHAIAQAQGERATKH